MAQICKNFLWGIENDGRRFLCQSWAALSKPKTEGGFDIKEILSWNKAQAIKWIRKLETQPHSSGSNGLKPIYLRGTLFGMLKEIDYILASWNNLLAARTDLVQQVGLEAAQALLAAMPNSFAAGQVYDLLRSPNPSVPWRYTVYDTAVYPNHGFVGHLAIQHKLPTIDRFISRGFQWINRCVLCGAAEESHTHLFFECSWTAILWSTIQQVYSFDTHSTHLFNILDWYYVHNRERSWVKKRRRSALLCLLYYIWQERNTRIFRDKTRTARSFEFDLCSSKS
ncbi:uncharacterized protein LOC141629515 [Silene latifolia]|uniref:uncharacterized protein LOC141629515 n=1 Tax=Silene latifolia TaxID=37657 RepID=UPI003D77D3F0